MKLHQIAPRAALLGLLLFAALCFWPGLSGGFIFDDYHNVQVNPRLQMTSLDAASLKQAATGYQPGAYGRPLATLSLAFDHYFHGKDPRGFKLTNLAIHLFNALLAFLLVRRLLALDPTRNWSPWAAVAVATAWAAHPLQVSTVLYVVQRMEMLAASFVVLSLLCYLSGRQRQMLGVGGTGWIAAAMVIAGLGMLSKESAVLAPLFMLVIEATLLRFKADSPVVERWLKRAYLVAVVVGAGLFFGWLLPRYAAPESFAIRDFTLTERLFTQLRVLPLYLGQSLLPLPDLLVFYYDNYPPSKGLFTPWTTAAGGVLLCALLVAAWAWRRKAPIASLGILWFFVAHALTSGPLNLELVFEHRNYLALLGVLLVAAEGIRRIPMQDGPSLKVAAIGVALAFLGTMTTIRSATWGNSLLLASDLVARNPESPRASNDLAMAYIDLSGADPDSPLLSLGMQEFERGSRLPGASPLPEQGLLLMSAVSGYPTDPAWWDSLEKKIATQPLGPQQVMALDGLMTQHQRGYRIDAARLADAYETMVGRGSFPGHVYARLADFVLSELDDQARATRLFVQAVERDPADRAFAMRVLDTLVRDGRTSQAQAVEARMRELKLAP